ncbi:MAG: hypothetical protein K8R54_10520 [Bacteroidales bacterium]|nr:hypothetical protein [Bacteroidales bacterium]
MKKLTTEQAINLLKKGIEENNKDAIIDILSFDNDYMPNWLEVSNEVFEEWDKLVDAALDILEQYNK